MKYNEVKKFSDKELKTKIGELRFSIFEASMKNTLGQLTNPLSIRQMRRDVARMRTALRQQNNNKAGVK